MIQAINNRNNSHFGNGLPVYTKLDHQMRHNTTRPYEDGLLDCPADRIPTFQFKAPEEFIGSVTRFDQNDNAFGAVAIGGNDTFAIIRRPTSDGQFIYTCYDATAGVSSPGIFYLAFRLAADPPNEYRYFTEQWRALNFPCLAFPVGAP